MKWIAISTMVIDHVNQVVFAGTLPYFSYLGRLAFPCFAFLVAYNIVQRSVPPRRYVWPLLVCGLLAQPIHSWAFGFFRSQYFCLHCLSVSFFLALEPQALAYARRKNVSPVLAYSALVLAVFPFALFSEYHVFGAYLVPLFAAFVRRSSLSLGIVVAFYLILTNYILIPLSLFTLLFFPTLAALKLWQRPLPRTSRWFFYVFYPLHLALLKLIHLAL